MTSDTIDKTAQGLAHGEYSLLLGAGASIGAVGGNGRRLPTGAGLRDALIEGFGADSGDEIPSLSEIYGYLERRPGNEVRSFLREWFTNCTPTWQSLLADFHWRRIWTLNIDDVIEVAFRDQGRRTESLTWNERFSDRNVSAGHQVIHLHGMAEKLTRDSDQNALVFSLSDYAREIANPQTWHKVFFDEFASKPFVVIGARLTEEIDLIETLNRGNTANSTTGFPSIVVVPDITPMRREQLESSGFTVILNDGETFVRDLRERYWRFLSNLDGIYGPMGTPGSRKFLQQFIDLRTYTPNDVNSGDFYSGYQPSWNTIVSEDDAHLDRTFRSANQITGLAKNDQNSQRIVLITGNPGSGKSTGLLRIASNLRGQGMFPFLFRGDEYMDVDAVVEWLKTVPWSVLLFDDFADHSSTLQRLADQCKEEKVRLLLIGADRPARHPIICDRIDGEYLDLRDAHWYGRLTNEDVDRIIAKLYDRGRLGKITRLPRDQQRRHFITSADRSLFDAMADLEEGAGFREKVRSIYHKLPTDGLRNLYAAACVCYDQSIPIPTGIGASFAGVAPRDLVRLVENECRGVLVITRAGIRPPHRITATLAVNTLPRSVRASTSLALAKALSPHIDERSMREGTREYRITRHLMNHETVIRHSGETEGRKWYEELRPYYDWNGRYWDQRALFESRFEQHETARSFAERSVQVHPHSFGYNTLGTILLRMAIRLGSEPTLTEGIKNLGLSRDFRDWGRREHPYTAFFASILRFADVWGIDSVPPQVRHAWDAWFAEAQSSQAFSTLQGRDQLLNWQRQWLNFAAIS